MLWLDYKAFDPVASFLSWGYPLPDPGTPEGTCLLEIFAMYLLFWRPLIQSDRGLRLKSFCLASNFASTTSEMPRPSLSPVLPVFLSTVRAGRSQTGWRWKSGRLCTSSAYKSPDSPPGLQTLGSWDWPWPVFQYCMPLLCSPWSSQEEGGAHPGEEPRPPSARRLGRPGPSPEAQRHPPESWFAPLWALGSSTGARRFCGAQGCAPTRQRRPLPGRPLLGAPLPRTPARRSACWALSCVQPCRAMDDLRVLWMRDRVYNAFGITDPQLFEELLNRNDGKAEELILHFLNQTSDEEGASTLFFYRKVVPEEVEVEIGEPPAAFPPCPLRPCSFPPFRLGRQIPAHPPLLASQTVRKCLLLPTLSRHSPGTRWTGQAHLDK